MVTQLNQFGITQVVRDYLKTDSTLYGSRKLINEISADPIKYEREKVSTNKSYRIYAWASDSDPIEERSNNAFDSYRLDFKFVAKSVKLINAYERYCQAWERVKVLMRAQMSNGLMLSEYYTDANAQIYSFSPLPSTLPSPIVNDDGVLVTKLEGAFIIEVNRY